MKANSQKQRCLALRNDLLECFALLVMECCYSSGSQTFLKKLRNGPLAIFLMAHGPLEKLTQNNTLIFYCINVTRALASLQTYSRKMNNLLELD